MSVTNFKTARELQKATAGVVEYELPANVESLVRRMGIKAASKAGTRLPTIRSDVSANQENPRRLRDRYRNIT